MKKIVVALSLMCIILHQTAKAVPGPTLPFPVEWSFKQKFPNANGVEWKKVKDVFIGSFIWEGKTRLVYYNEEGEFLGSGRHISFQVLPMTIAEDISERFRDYPEIAVFEYSSASEGIQYYLQLSNEKATVYIQASGHSINILKKIKTTS